MIYYFKFRFVGLLIALLGLVSASLGQGPSVKNIVYSPTPLPIRGGAISVTASVSSGLNKNGPVNLVVNGHDGSLKRSSPMVAAADGISYSGTVSIDLNTSNSVRGEQIFVDASDFAGRHTIKLVAEQGFSNVVPVVTALTSSPNPIPVRGATVAVSAQVTDKLLPLSEIRFHVYNPDGSEVRSSIGTLGSDGVTYSANMKVDLNTSNSKSGQSITVSANDVAGNATTKQMAVQGFSKVPPVIAAITSSPNPIPVRGATITFSAKVTDSLLPLTEVRFHVYKSDGYDLRSVVGVVGSDGVTYSASLPVDINRSNTQSGEWTAVSAIDVAGNASAKQIAIQGYSTTPPVITAISSSPNPIPVRGATVTFSAKVTDNLLPLTEVRFHVYRTDGVDLRSVVGVVGSDGVTYSASLPVDINRSNTQSGEWTAVSAIDVAGNASSTQISIQGFSNVPPVITGITSNPNPIPPRGATVALSAKITDSQLPLAEVRFHVYRADGVELRANLGVLASDGITYSTSIVVDMNKSNSATGEYITVSAIDIAGNAAATQIAVQGFSNTLPLIANVTVSPAQIPAAGATMAVTCTTYDAALPITYVVIHVYGADGSSIRTTTAVSSDGKLYAGSVKIDPNTVAGKLGESIWIEVTDAAGNVAKRLVLNQRPA